jgi:hypothetical protein
MTAITNLVEKLETTNNKAYKEFADQQTQRQFVRQLSQTSFYESYKLLFYTAFCISFVAQVASAISSYSYFEALLTLKITHPYLLAGAVTVLLAIIEVIKYTVVNKSFKELFALQPQQNTALFIIAFLVSSLSIYASVTGGGKLGTDTTQPQAVSKQFDTEIASLKNDITGIQARNTWKGQTYLPTKEKNLLYAKENEIAALKAKKESALQAVTAQNETNKTQFQIGFAAFELLFFVCTIFVWYYKRRSSVEFLAVTPDTITTATVQLTTKTQTVIAPPPTEQGTTPSTTPTPPGPENPDTPPAPSKRIGFVFGKKQPPTADVNTATPKVSSPTTTVSTSTTADVSSTTASVGNGNKVCLHCNKVYTYQIHNQKYCSETCRVAAWEKRNGRRLKKRKVPQSTKTSSLF